ncbi:MULTISPECIES: hypothetical protein [unclassified Exiguobacterium]|uniref:hypothetical protein n=1 Tax=unclassified Exiguobacterium TaxID=2644629 RepID=UPI00103D1BB1|nr:MULTISPECIES: hypothetical protein [unclassified Exiguobacterium]TCI68897.1 hypothetical protein EVJ19_09985 [Exiguobacterium sp. IPCI3]TCI78395.1 hypothetical protein EVJ18_09985 [Exiguobacterium sp. IPCH1]TCI79652.1 hypothetical protein EVJ17_09985 [Exiguobacterium sp. IPBC4]
MWKRVGMILAVFLLAACSNESDQPAPTLGADAKVAKAYLEEQGYDVVSYRGNRTSSFEKEDLLELPTQSTWQVQTPPPDDYIGRDIRHEYFIVRDHPLDDVAELGQTNVSVMMVDGEIIGGTSFPDSAEPLVGSAYSLDGKTVEELHPDYMEWRSEWEAKYSE